MLKSSLLEIKLISKAEEKYFYCLKKGVKIHNRNFYVVTCHSKFLWSKVPIPYNKSAKTG